MRSNQIESFSYGSTTLTTKFIETMQVTDGVECDVYIHPETNERDLAIITIAPGKSTPLQKVLNGEETIEGYISGKGRLVITHVDGSESIFEVDQNSVGFAHTIKIGEIMQWHADNNEELVLFEICYPPYEDGRYENLN